MHLAAALGRMSVAVAAVFGAWCDAAAPALPAHAKPWSLTRPLAALFPSQPARASRDTRNGHATKRGPGRRHSGGRPYHARPDDRPQTLFAGRSTSIAKLQRLPRCGAARGA